MRALEDLPDEDIHRIIGFICSPFDHISFSRCSPVVGNVYTANAWSVLCRKYGFGLSLSDRTKISWVRQFERVVQHFLECTVLGCRHYGVIAPGTAGRVLGSMDAVRSYRWRGGDVALHRHVSVMGNINFGDFLNGYFSTIPDLFSLPGRPFPESAATAFDDYGVDWDEEDGVLRKTPCAPNLSDHPLLASAFACRPPVAHMRLKLYEFVNSISVENEAGITVKDVIDVLREWYDGAADGTLAAALSDYIGTCLPFLNASAFDDITTFTNREHMLQTLYNMQAANGRLAYQGFQIGLRADGDVTLSMVSEWRYRVAPQIEPPAPPEPGVHPSS